jgi:hypothetical protein
MRLYNGTNSGINLPLNNGQRLIVGPKSISNQFMPSIEFLTLIVTAYSRNDIALVLSGATEIQMCSTVSTIPGYIAQTVQEAVERFNPVTPETTTVEEQKSDELDSVSEEPKSKVIENDSEVTEVSESSDSEESSEDSEEGKKRRGRNKK